MVGKNNAQHGQGGAGPTSLLYSSEKHYFLAGTGVPVDELVYLTVTVFIGGWKRDGKESLSLSTDFPSGRAAERCDWVPADGGAGVERRQQGLSCSSSTLLPRCGPNSVCLP